MRGRPHALALLLAIVACDTGNEAELHPTGSNEVPGVATPPKNDPVPTPPEVDRDAIAPVVSEAGGITVTAHPARQTGAQMPRPTPAITTDLRWAGDTLRVRIAPIAQSCGSQTKYRAEVEPGRIALVELSSEHPLARCVAPHEIALEIQGLAPGSWSIEFHDAGGPTPAPRHSIPIEVPEPGSEPTRTVSSRP